MKYPPFSALLPQNYLEEQILLGMLLINPALFPVIVSLITIESFFLEENQVIYENLLKLYKKNRLYHSQLMYSLVYSENLGEIGGIEKLMNLMKQGQFFTISVKMNRYAEDIIKDMNNHYIRRLMIQYAYNIITLAYVKTFPSHQLYNRASSYLNITSKKIPKESIIDFKDLIGEFLFNIHNKYYQKDEIEISSSDNPKILSGFAKLDRLINGITNGDLFVIAGRPSMGKTSLAINIINNILHNFNIGISIFSLEMSKMQILKKLISVASKISTNYMKWDTIKESYWIKINQTCQQLLDAHIYLNDTPEMSVDYIEYTAKLLEKETPYIEIIFIDYLQLIQVETFNYPTRTQELSYITRKLKLLAQALNIPIIILSQLNRSIEKRSNKKPVLSDLKESGCLNIIQKFYIDQLNNLNICNLVQYKLFLQLNKTRANISSFININSKIKLWLFIHYLYKIILNKNKNYCIDTTYSHRIYHKNTWIKPSEVLDNFNILKDNKNCDSQLIFEYIYIQKINYITKKQVYDIKAPNALSFTCKNVILHNSIEQDADIVMILYQEENENNLHIVEKTIDVFLCKNRNGPTGFFQLLFTLTNTTFTDLITSELSYL